MIFQDHDSHNNIDSCVIDKIRCNEIELYAMDSAGTVSVYLSTNTLHSVENARNDLLCICFPTAFELELKFIFYLAWN